ncbi:MAG: M23 family metallopeptidase [Tissierellia bacterium]|nr:M23 family metallopeptidase [Tissierellia bacterium]
MKKIYLLLILLFFITGCGVNTSDINEIEIINSQNGEKYVVNKDSQTTKNIINAINQKEKITSEDISSLVSFELLLHKKNEVDAYMISFDVDNKSVYISKDDNYYKVKDNIIESLLLDDYFSYIYVDKSINKLYLYKNGNKIIPNIQYEWSFKKINNSLGSKSGILSHKNEKLQFNNDDIIDIKFDVMPDSQITYIYLEGDLIYTCKNISDIINIVKNDGEYYIESHYKWYKKSNLDYYGSQTINFMAVIDKPADLNVLTKENYPGNIMVLNVENLNDDETVNIQTNIIQDEIKLFSYNDKMTTIIPLDLSLNSGSYQINAIFNEGKKNQYLCTTNIRIDEKKFKTQYLMVSEELNNSNNDDKSIQEFVEVVKAVRTNSFSEKLWSGQFIMPVEGRLTTDFAEIRYVNNVYSSRHSGIDIAAPTGTEIRCPNNGKVVLAINGLLSSGNTVVIDHGLGLFTSYYHLDSILVKEGEVVKTGDIIGTVGSTGFSTGPHLHYSVSIYNTYVNPYQPLSGIFD